jgi:hypothetical protein
LATGVDEGLKIPCDQTTAVAIDRLNAVGPQMLLQPLACRGFLLANSHTDRHTAAGRLQLRTNVGQNSVVRSADQPGSSPQSAATQRAGVGLGLMAGGGVSTGGGVAGAVVTAGFSPLVSGGRTGLLVQAASIPRMKASPAAGKDWRQRASGASRPNKGSIVMWLILLEAAAALLILVLIVWWTMFSGRKNGERNRAGNDNKESQ